MKLFERFIRYLCTAGVIFAAVLAIFPKLSKSLMEPYGLIIGPILVIALLIFAIYRNRQENAKF